MLVKSVIQSIHVYWFSLAMIPASVINNIRKIFFHFPWIVNFEASKFHLTSWESISLVKNLGGWGLKQLDWFSYSLSVKIQWRGLFGDELQSEVIKSKYIKSFSVVQWIQNPQKSTSNASIIWRGLLRTYPIMGEWLSQRIGRDTHVFLVLTPLLALLETISYITLCWLNFII